MSISLDSIGIAAGDTAPYSLDEYYGVQFTDGTTSPASGEISLNDFLNKTIGSAWNQTYYGYTGNYPQTTGMSYDGTRIAYPSSNNQSVYIYEKSNNGTWSLIGTISTPNGVNRVGLSGDGSRVIVGEQTYNNYQGRARVFQYASGTTWNQVGGDIKGTAYVLYGSYLTGSYGGAGSDISGDGNSVVLGEWRYDDPNINFSTAVGRVTVWNYSNGSWTQRGTEQIGTHHHPTNYSENYGFHVSISHDGTVYAAAGAGYRDSAGVNTGRTRIFQYTNGSWNQLGQDLINGYEGAVRPILSGNGMKVILSDRGSSPYQTVRVFEYYNNTWNQTFSVANATTGSISRDGLTITISRYTTNATSSYTDVYEWDGSNWVQMGSRINGTAYIGLSARSSEDGSSYIVSGRYGVYVREFG